MKKRRIDRKQETNELRAYEAAREGAKQIKVPEGLRQATREVGDIEARIAEANRQITAVQQSGRVVTSRVTALGTLVSDDVKENWRNDAIQFPRLIAELQMAGAITTHIMEVLCESMDVTQTEMCQLLDRADRKWEAIKEQLP